MATPVAGLAERLLSCACEALADAGRPACACYATVGPPVIGPAQCCECEEPDVTGELTINFEQLYPANQDLQRVTRIYPCRTGGRAADFTLVLTRCYPRIDEAGNMPGPDEVQAATDALHQDLELMWRAMTCCPSVRLLWREVAVDSDPEGGCSMLAARVTVEA